MSKNLPVAMPAEMVAISPEGLEIANAYLELQDIGKVSERLGVGSDLVSSYLDKREVKSYIDNVFFDLGYNNRFKIRAVMDAVIQTKLQEMMESETGSSKDIADLLALSHKMTMEQMDKQIALEKIRSGTPSRQTNVQINNLGGSKYGELIGQLLKMDDNEIEQP